MKKVIIPSIIGIILVGFIVFAVGASVEYGSYEEIQQDVKSSYDLEACTKTYTVATYVWVERKKNGVIWSYYSDGFILKSWYEYDVTEKEIVLAKNYQRIEAEKAVAKYLKCGKKKGR